MDNLFTCRRELPYPDPSEINGTCREGRMLSCVYAGREGELTAVCQYMYQATLLFDALPELSQRLSCIATTEMEHFLLIGRAMQACGTDPRLFDCSRERDLWWSGAYVNTVTDPAGMLLQDMADERRALRTYGQMANLVSDPKLGGLLARIASDEALHVEILEEEYRKLIG